MNVWFHLLFGGIAVLFFLWEFWRRRRAYQLIFACWVASTFLTYLSDVKWFQLGLGVAELLFCAAALFTLWRARKADQKANQQNKQEN